MTSSRPLPSGAQLLGWIDRHPTDHDGRRYSVVGLTGGIEVAWNGNNFRSLPHDCALLCPSRKRRLRHRSDRNINSFPLAALQVCVRTTQPALFVEVLRIILVDELKDFDVLCKGTPAARGHVPTPWRASTERR